MSQQIKRSYIVVFEPKSDEIRQRVKVALKSFGSYCPIDSNCWAVFTDKTSVEIRDIVAAALDPKDKLFVIRSGTEAAWRNPFDNSNSEWLKKYL